MRFVEPGESLRVRWVGSAVAEVTRGAVKVKRRRVGAREDRHQAYENRGDHHDLRDLADKTFTSDARGSSLSSEIRSGGADSRVSGGLHAACCRQASMGEIRVRVIGSGTVDYN
ncbi:hypothetical protein EVAR_93493_1 [Eumeta japonica]|uniref:Uncharacterized protein n=1 Tax=Eumeta variegata TaxID=151549 RepID=A0A4C1TJF4_EUMVA|nr:hypothetical protein EVAR_93493_1 [Eumeta japonica]